MLIELSDELFGSHVVQADGTMVRHSTKHFLLKVRELSLIDLAGVACSFASYLCMFFDHESIFEVDTRLWMEDGFGAI